MIQVILVLILLTISQGSNSKFQDRSLIKLFEDAANKNITSQECTKSINLFLDRLNAKNNEHIWALKMLQASAEAPLNLLSYNSDNIGHFYQCIEEVESGLDQVFGKYCLASLYLNNSLVERDEIKEEIYLQKTLTKVHGKYEVLGLSNWAFCIPKKCTNEDASKLMKSFQIKGMELNSISCQTHNDIHPELSKNAIIGLTIFGFLACIILLSTIFDIQFHQEKKGTVYQIITAFSAYANGKRLFQKAKYSSHLSCLDGIKVISLWWVFILHISDCLTIHPLYNAKNNIKFRESILSNFVYSGGLACDSFFLIGGALIMYVYFKKETQEDFTILKILKHYLHRYIRLVAPLAGVILFNATLMKYIGSGSAWQVIVSPKIDSCEKNWWTALLFVQNIVDNEHLCLVQTWYIDIDMQLYLLSPFILILLKRHFKTGVVGVFLITLLSLILTFIRFYESVLGDRTDYYQTVQNYAHPDRVYYNTETRAAPWFIGTLLGYALASKRLKNIQLSKKITIPLWILTLIILVYCTLGGHESLVSTKYARIQTAIFMTLFRPVFAIAVGWIIWACSTNHGGIINSILSHPVFQFLNKFTYSIYLVHLSIMFPLSGAIEPPINVNFLYVAYGFWGLYMFSFFLSIVWMLVFEIPAANLEKIVFNRK